MDIHLATGCTKAIMYKTLRIQDANQANNDIVPSQESIFAPNPLIGSNDPLASFSQA